MPLSKTVDFGPRKLEDLIDDVLHQIINAAEVLDIERQRLHGHNHDHERPGALLSLCMTSKRFRSQGASLIYRRATVCGFSRCRDGFCRENVRDPVSILSSITESEGFQHFGRVLSIELWDYARPQLAHSLKAALCQLHRLEKLRIMVCGPAVQLEFLQAFRDIAFQLPNLRILIMTSELQELIPKFSQISSLEIARSVAGLCASPEHILRNARLTSLRHLELSPHRPWSVWTHQFLTDLALRCPQLKTVGTVSCSAPSPPFSELLSALARFPEMTTLTVGPLYELGPLYQLVSGSRGGWKSGDISEADEKEWLEVANDLCFATFEECSQLQIVWIDNRWQAVCRRRPDGSVEEVSLTAQDRPGTRETLETSGFDMR